MKNVIDRFKDLFKKKKKKNWIDDSGDHPVHEKYVKQRPVKE
ncbi:MAG TPA: hypothetical protein VJK72_05355 [Candidatus Nanoarchaeia archaeon]|nr:hypothetical protein [Candidatus Nanoarchaeia archaeon]